MCSSDLPISGSRGKGTQASADRSQRRGTSERARPSEAHRRAKELHRTRSQEGQRAEGAGGRRPECRKEEHLPVVDERFVTGEAREDDRPRQRAESSLTAPSPPSFEGHDDCAPADAGSIHATPSETSRRRACGSEHVLRGQLVDRRARRVDLRGKSAIPAHEYVSALVDLVDDTAIARTQPGVVARVLDELDSRADSDPRADPRREESGTVRVHDANIGFGNEKLYPPEGRKPNGLGELAPRRRTVPNSTA